VAAVTAVAERLLVDVAAMAAMAETADLAASAAAMAETLEMVEHRPRERPRQQTPPVQPMAEPQERQAPRPQRQLRAGVMVVAATVVVAVRAPECRFVLPRRLVNTRLL